MSTRQNIMNQRGDLSPFLIHLTRDGLFSTDPTQAKTQTVHAKNSLVKIIHDKKIVARSAMGYFNYKVAWPERGRNLSSLVQRNWLYSACFTETPIDHIQVQFQTIPGRSCHFKNYGLAFFDETARKRKANPVFYVDTKNQAMRDGFDDMASATNCIDYKGIMPFVEGFGSPWFPTFYGPSEIDFRWEREWRASADFDFLFPEVAFGICPENEIPYFEALTSGEIKFVDVSNPVQLKLAKEKLATDIRFQKLKL